MTNEPDALVEALCEVMHDAYEQAAREEGWETQARSRVVWGDVPEANKATMRTAVRAMLDHLYSLPETPVAEPRPMSLALKLQLDDILSGDVHNPGTRQRLTKLVQSVDANAHARGRAEAAAIVDVVLANVDELVEASSPDATITVDQATVVRALLREALGAPDTYTQAAKRAAWAEGARFAYGYTSGMTPAQIDTGGPLPAWIADRNPYGAEFPGTIPDEEAADAAD